MLFDIIPQLKDLGGVLNMIQYVVQCCELWVTVRQAADSTASASGQEITEKGKRGTRYTTYFELMLNIKNSKKVWSFYNSHFMYGTL